jgi:hypothetical protein
MRTRLLDWWDALRSSLWLVPALMALAGGGGHRGRAPRPCARRAGATRRVLATLGRPAVEVETGGDEAAARTRSRAS